MRVSITIDVDIDEKKAKPRGPVERLDNGAPDVLAMVRHRVAGAFSYVEGFTVVKMTDGSIEPERFGDGASEAICYRS